MYVDETPNNIQKNDDTRKQRTITAFYLCALLPSYLGKSKNLENNIIVFL